MLTKDIAICIRAIDYSETSQIVTFFTRANGKISAIAKGSKRPKSAFDGPIEILSQGRIVFSDSSKERLATLTEFEQQPGLVCRIRDLFTLNCSLFAAELVNRLTNDYDPHPGLFDSFHHFLQRANEHREVLSLLIQFQLILLKEIGLQPVWSHCVNCKTRYERPATSDEFYFSSSANGLICRDCEASFPDKIRLSRDASACLADVKRICESEEATLQEIEKVLVSYFTELLGRPPRMAKHIVPR
jgi:DNA repair protein RecO (recombination protein O)